MKRLSTLLAVLAAPLFIVPSFASTSICVSTGTDQFQVYACEEVALPSALDGGEIWDDLERLVCDALLGTYGPTTVTFPVTGQTINIPELCSGAMTGQGICALLALIEELGDIYLICTGFVAQICASTGVCPPGALPGPGTSLDDLLGMDTDLPGGKIRQPV